MAAPKAKSPEQLAARRAQVSELYLKAHSMSEIGKMLGVTIGTIFRDVQWAREQWRTRAADAIEILKQRELSKLDVIEVEAWRAWERSIGVHVITTEKSGVGPNGTDSEETHKSERLAGDPRYLQIIEDCIKQRRAILGLDAPTRSELTGANGKPLVQGITVKFVRHDGESIDIGSNGSND